eukprot:scaffold3780_cov66-Cyclotella_meneghiniana.AAC.1
MKQGLKRPFFLVSFFGQQLLDRSHLHHSNSGRSGSIVDRRDQQLGLGTEWSVDDASCLRQSVAAIAATLLLFVVTAVEADAREG